MGIILRTEWKTWAKKIFLPLVLFPFFSISLWRFINAIFLSFNSYKGELLANFPFFFRLKYYNPLLYHSIITNAPNRPWFENTWFYGPIHHLWLFPLTLVSSVEQFFNLLLIFYVCLTICILFVFYNTVKKNKDYLFLITFFTVALGSFALLDNLIQRNVELLEFSLIIISFLCLTKKREYVAGSLLCVASMAKLFPFIFLPYLLIKKKFKAFFGFLITFIIIVAITQITLNWRNYQLFTPTVAQHHGLPILNTILGNNYFTEISHVRGSLYTFILSFFANIDMGKSIPIITYKIDNFFIPNSAFLILALLILMLTFYLLYKTSKEGDLLYEYSIVSLVMLLIYPRYNPHYYIFTILSFVTILRTLTYDLDTYRLSLLTKIIVFFIYIFSLLFLGNLIPFSVYNKILPLKNVAFHYFSTYSLFGLGTFILWCLIIWFYWRNYKTNIIKAKE